MNVLYTDGSVIGNPGPGGWAYLLKYGDKERKGSGLLVSTTNNRAEMTAVIQGLAEVVCRNRHGHSTLVISDSQYVVKGFSEYLENWKQRGWVTKEGNPVANKDLWLEIEMVSMRLSHVAFKWVKGHADNQGNLQVDELARAKATRFARAAR